jgi:hypothetical protein
LILAGKEIRGGRREIYLPDEQPDEESAYDRPLGEKNCRPIINSLADAQSY